MALLTQTSLYDTMLQKEDFKEMTKLRRCSMIMLSIATVALSALSFSACGAEEDANAPVELEIHDSYADIEDIGDGNAELIMQGVITNKSSLKTVGYDSLPYLTMDGQEVETIYEPMDSDDTDKVAPGKSVVYTVIYDFDPNADHEWKFGTRENTVVNGLDDYVCIKEAKRNFEGKPQVTMEEIKKVEEEQKQKFEEFLKEEQNGGN